MIIKENTVYRLVNGDRVTFTLKKNHFTFGQYHWLSNQGRMYNPEGKYILLTTTRGANRTFLEQFNVEAELGVPAAIPVPEPACRDMVEFTLIGSDQRTQLFGVTDDEILRVFHRLLLSHGQSRFHVRIETKLVPPKFGLEEATKISKSTDYYYYPEYTVHRAMFNSNKEFREAIAVYILFECLFSQTDEE
jgi:hypothetical protein